MPRRRYVVRYVRARRRYRRHRLPILPLLGLGIGIASGVNTALDADWSNAQQHPDWVLNGISQSLIGYDFINQHTTFMEAFKTYGFALLGYVGHLIMNRLGVNRKMPDGLAL